MPGADAQLSQLERLKGRVGVTRIARVTGLDRTGVEVACAVRPDGHVLQVANGKGRTFVQAARTALSEAAELWAAEQVDPVDLRWNTHAGWEARGQSAWTPLEAGPCSALELWNPELRLAWRAGTELFSRTPVWLPAQALHCLREGDWPLGPQVVDWTTNGMGAHPVRARAVEHALLEVLEREQLAQSLPEGWTEEAVATRQVEGDPLPLVRALAARGFDAFLYELTPRGGVPLAGALLFDREEGPVPLTAGYACSESPMRALEAALLEAAQSRLTDVHGAREDVAPADRGEAQALRALCGKARRRVRLPRPTSARAALRRMGLSRAAVADLTPAGSPLHVVKVIVPGARVSGLL